MRYAICLVLLLSGWSLTAQRPTKHRAPIWYAPARNTATYGVSLGPVHFWSEDALFAIHGVGIELGMGVLLPLATGYSLSELLPEEVVAMDTTPALKRLNGINLSATGSVGVEQINGLSFNGLGTSVGRLRGFQASLILSMGREINGISAAFAVNDAYRVNGAQIALIENNSAVHNGLQLSIFNQSKKMRGLQIGIYNQCTELHGLQIGIWNKVKGRGFLLFHWG